MGDNPNSRNLFVICFLSSKQLSFHHRCFVGGESTRSVVYLTIAFFPSMMYIPLGRAPIFPTNFCPLRL